MNQSVTGLFNDSGLYVPQPDGSSLPLAKHLDVNGTRPWTPDIKTTSNTKTLAPANA
jgi:hypothetical protein